MQAQKTATAICSLLVLLFAYTAVTKWINLPLFRAILELQPFGKPVISALAWGVPLSESVTVLLLLFNRTRLTGLWMSLLILVTFTGYAILVIAGYFPHRPCGCGGIVSDMSWEEHLLFNLCFLILTIGALFLNYRQRIGAGKNALQSGVAEYL